MQPVYAGDIRAAENQQWKLNSTALKYIRDTHEDPPGKPTVPHVDLSQKDPMQILTLSRTSGEAYELVKPYQEWSWLKMLHSLSHGDGGNDLLQKLVGPEGITGVWCMPLPDSYDHKRAHAAKKNGLHFADGIQLPIWDFVILRGDGEAVRFHPIQTNRKILRGFSK